jgi:hypothetical protein
MREVLVVWASASFAPPNVLLKSAFRGFSASRFVEYCLRTGQPNDSTDQCADER